MSKKWWEQGYSYLTKGKPGTPEYELSDEEQVVEQDWLQAELGKADYSTGYSASHVFNRWGSPWSSSSDQNQKMDSALKEAARTVNVIRQRFGIGKAKTLKVAWSDGATREGQKGLEKDTIMLSPDIVSDTHTRKKEWSPDQLNDALIGSGLLATGLRTTMSPAAITKHFGRPEEERQLTEILWHASETDTARRAVCEDFRGYAPYFKAIIEYHTNNGFKEALENRMKYEIQNKKPTAVSAMELHAWNCLHPDERIAAPEAYRGAMELLGQVELALQGDADSASRYERCRAAAEAIDGMFVKTKKPKSPIGGAGASGQGFGGIIQNSVDASLAKAAALDVSKDSGTEVDQNIRDRSRDIRIWSNQTLITNGAMAFAKVVTASEPLIQQLKRKLKFRAIKKTFAEPDFRSGELDEYVLPKMCVDRKDDRVFVRTEERGQPSVAFTILIDESGSMSYDNRFYHARILAYVLAKTMEAYDGIDVAVLGHTSDSACEILHYYTPEQGKASQCLPATAHISARGGTDEGMAVAMAAHYAKRWFGRKTRRNIVVSISDGGTNIQECRKQCDIAKNNGVDIYGIGLGHPYSEAQGTALYGDGRFAIVGESHEAIQVLGSFISRVATTGK